ncbi:MAG: EAL domain-containing protein [Acidaminococcaceae bacterium]
MPRKMVIRLRVRKLLLIVFLFCLLSILGGFSFVAAAYNTPGAVIKVGTAGDEDLEIAEGGASPGFSYEFLQDIAGHTGWQYEFVPGNLAESLARLEKGEIDLLVNLQRSPVREGSFLYSKNYTSIIYSVLCVSKNREDVYFEDFAKFDGMLVGLLRNSVIGENLQKYAAANKFNIKRQYFADMPAMLQALRNGDIDAVAVGSFTKIDDVKVVARFQPQPGFFLASKGNENLIDGIDNACNKIFADNLSYRENLQIKHYGDSLFSQLYLTREEAGFIRTLPAIKVVYDSDCYPLNYYDKETAAARGIAVDFLKNISDKTGLKFDFVQKNNDRTFDEKAVPVRADIICEYDKMGGDGSSDTFRMSKPYMELPLSFLGGKGNLLAGSFSVGVSEEHQEIIKHLKKNQPQVRIFTYRTLEDAMAALERGNVDSILDGTYVLYKYLQSSGSNEYILLPYGVTGQEMRFGVSSAQDPRLFSVINKAIAAMSAEERQDIITKNIARVPYQITLQTLVKKYFYQLTAFLIFLFMAGFAYYLLLEKRKRKELAKIAFCDRLTGLRNFEKFKIDAAKSLKNAASVIVMFDINRFRSVITAGGAKEGRRLLRLLAAKVESSIGKKEMLAHGSNDLFIMLLQDKGDAAIRERLLYLQKSIKEELLASGALYNISLAFGVYRPGKDDGDLEKMLEFVDLARLEAKKNHKDGIAFYEADLGERNLREAEIENKMDQALQKREFIVVYQPKYDLKTEMPAGAEALVRWSSDKGLLMPGEFIDVFERTGFVLKLDLYVFEQVCADIRRWLDAGRIVLPIAVNISRLHLLDPDFVHSYRDVINKYRVPPELLELEITEDMPMSSADFLAEEFNNIVALGVSLAIDDFGSGYSSLNVLHAVPFETLKIDKGFFRDKTGSERGRRIIETIVFMAQKLGMSVVAEGVETRQQVDFLKAIGCDSAQGYYFARPMPSSEFENMLSWEVV